MGAGFEGNAKGFNGPTGSQVLADWLDESGLHPAADEPRHGQTDTAELPRSGYGYGHCYGNGYG